MSGLELLDIIRDYLGAVSPPEEAIGAEAELRELLKALGRLTR